MLFWRAHSERICETRGGRGCRNSCPHPKPSGSSLIGLLAMPTARMAVRRREPPFPPPPPFRAYLLAKGLERQFHLHLPITGKGAGDVDFGMEEVFLHCLFVLL